MARAIWPRWEMVGGAKFISAFLTDSGVNGGVELCLGILDGLIDAAVAEPHRDECDKAVLAQPAIPLRIRLCPLPFIFPDALSEGGELGAVESDAMLDAVGQDAGHAFFG